jgi:hypothetical protein
MKILSFILVVVVSLASLASAQPADPDPNGIGIYFDQGAVDGSWCASGDVGTQVTAYLCLTRGSDQSGFTAWEAPIESSVPSALAAFQIQGDATNTAVAPEFVVTYATPLPWQLSTVLLEITLDVVWEWSIALRVWPASVPSGEKNLPAYATVDEPAFVTLGYSFGWDQVSEIPNWCASINDDACPGGPSVDVEDSAWGRVKALYR